MTATKITSADRAAIVRDAWSRAYVAAIAASEPVRLHLGAAFREAWAEFRRDRAEGRERVTMTAGYEERYGRSDRAMARQHLGRLLAEKAAAAAAEKASEVENHWSTFVPSPDASLDDEDDLVCDLDDEAESPAAPVAVDVMRGIILKRMDLNGAAMTRLLEERDRDVAVYGMSSLTDRTYDLLDDLHTDGVNLRGALADIDAGGIVLVLAGQHADAVRIAELRARDACLTREIEGLAAAAQAWVEGRDVPGAGDAVPTFDRLWEEREWLRVRINADESEAAAKARAPVQLGFVGMLVPAWVPQQATL